MFFFLPGKKKSDVKETEKGIVAMKQISTCQLKEDIWIIKKGFQVNETNTGFC